MPRDKGYEGRDFALPASLSPQKRWGEFLKLLYLCSKKIIDNDELIIMLRSLLGPHADQYAEATLGGTKEQLASGGAGGSGGGAEAKDGTEEADEEDAHPLTTGDVAAHKLTRAERANQTFMARRRHDEAAASLETSHRRRESLLDAMQDLIDSKGIAKESHMESIWCVASHRAPRSRPRPSPSRYAAQWRYFARARARSRTCAHRTHARCPTVSPSMPPAGTRCRSRNST
jgi:hypothetical protein